MAAETLRHTLTTDEWTLIAEGKKVVAVQLTSTSTVWVFMAEAGVEPDEESPGILIGRGTSDLPNAWSAAGLPDDTNVWAISRKDAAEDVIVMSY